MFYFDYIDGKQILKSDLIKNANAFFTTREICICDKGDSNNFEIKKNIKTIENYLGNNLISPIQTHSANIETAIENRFNYPNTDGLILTKNNMAIFLNFADCTPLIFYDEKQNIGAVSHAGWRGTAQKIAQITGIKLIQKYGSKPEDISVLIGPAICEKCYAVGEDVYNLLINSVQNFEPSKNKKDFYIDLKKINKQQLTEIGIEKIDICPYCSCCDNEYFFSYRKEHGTTLRHSAVLKLY